MIAWLETVWVALVIDRQSPDWDGVVNCIAVTRTEAGARKVLLDWCRNEWRQFHPLTPPPKDEEMLERFFDQNFAYEIGEVTFTDL